MFDALTAARWSAQPRFLQSLRHWSWCRDAWPDLIVRVGADVQTVPVVDAVALARAFWQWAACLDSEARFEPLDGVDYAHFQSGMWLSQLLWQRPVRLPGPGRPEEVELCTRTALTLLAAWRTALGAPPLEFDVPARLSRRWDSYVENVVEDPLVAVAFLDLFTGREPVWGFPTFPSERPAMRRALEERRRSAVV